VKRIIRWGIATGAAVALVLGSGVLAPAQAKPVPDASGNATTVARTSSGKAVTNQTVAAEVERFWTPARMAAAVDLDLKASSEQEPTIAAAPNGPAGSVAPVAPARSSFTNLNESAVVGKVYVSVPGGTGQCSASALASGKRRLVITAGHCVNAGAGGGWYSNFIFVPRFRKGVAPFGRFVARQLTARTAWTNNSSSDEDMAIAIMNNGGIYGDKVVDTVGGNGLRWNWGYSVSVTILGYPVAGSFPGDVQYYCQGTTWHGHGQQVRAWCNMTQGSSGGPWVMAYNDSNGLGYTNSVTSHRHGNDDQMDGPYFDNDIKSLYDYAEGLSPA
jgi:V8-like Glu-specific endopeptidase